MKKKNISKLLIDDYKMLARFLEGKFVKQIITCTETQIALLMEDDIIIRFQHLEDELIFDIEPGMALSDTQ